MSVGDRPTGVLLVKLGGSLITDKRTPDTLRPGVLRRLARELAAGREAARRRGRLVVLGHGSGSFGHVAAAESGIAELEAPADVPGVAMGIARTQAKAAELHRHVVAALLDAGLPAFSIAPSSAVTLTAGEPTAFTGHLPGWALEAGLLPVLYGDVAPDRERGAGICSTETVFRAVVAALEPSPTPVREALWLGETAGVYGADGGLLPQVDRLEDLAGGDAAGVDVTGGMAHRVSTCLELAGHGVASHVADGTVPGLLERALRGEEVPGTRVPAGRS